MNFKELSTSDYKFMKADFYRRYGLPYKHEIFDDLYYESKDGSYPGHRQYTKEEEDAYEAEHGFRMTYYWRNHRKVCHFLLLNKPEQVGRSTILIDTVLGVRIYEDRWSEEAMTVYYVFPHFAVGSVMYLWEWARL